MKMWESAFLARIIWWGIFHPQRAILFLVRISHGGLLGNNLQLVHFVSSGAVWRRCYSVSVLCLGVYPAHVEVNPIYVGVYPRHSRCLPLLRPCLAQSLLFSLLIFTGVFPIGDIGPPELTGFFDYRL